MHHRIVVGLDLGQYAEIVLEHALDQAASHRSPDLHFLHVMDRDAGDERVARAHADLAQLVLQGLETFAAKGADWRVRLHLRAGKPHEEICALAGEVDASLIVVGRFGPHRLLGRRSTAHRVLENAPCPTLAVTLVDRDVEATPQCPDCVMVRANTDGERWFCQRHRAPDRVTLATTSVAPNAWIGGTTLW